MAMKVALGSRVNICEVLQMMDIIESTRFQCLPEALRDWTISFINYHRVLAGRGADYSY